LKFKKGTHLRAFFYALPTVNLLALCLLYALTPTALAIILLFIYWQE